MILLEDAEEISFPDPGTLEESYPGLIAVGGNLFPNNILRAYKKGLFPWFSPDEPIMWWSTDPRMVLYPKNVRKQSEVKKLLTHPDYQISINRNPEAVIRQCASSPRPEQDGTWINEKIIKSYTALAAKNKVWTVGLWSGEQLLAGLYGIKIGNIFFGESMFTTIKNGSKACLVWLCETHGNDIELIDCQQETDHLKFMGAENISRDAFLFLLERMVQD